MNAAGSPAERRSFSLNIANNLATLRPLLGDAVLVAATKYVGPDEMRELLACGVADLGENRAQDFLAKAGALADLPIRWHFIGHLQTNKVKAVVDRIACLHSLDSFRLAEEIQKWRKGSPLDCFVEVNISGEAAKTGMPAEEVRDFVDGLAKYDKIKVVGLMGMAAETDDAETARKRFASLTALRDEIRGRALPWAPCEFLSMGMSRDFRTALECGATHVRLGSILFRNEG